MNTCPTVKVKSDAADNEAGYVVINETDFDPTVHERYGEQASDDAPDMTVRQLRDALDAKGIAYPPSANKTKLRALLDAA